MAAASATVTTVKRPGTEAGIEVEYIVLSNGADSTEICLHGATLTSWVVGCEEIIFVSKNSHFNNNKPIRGGIPLVFPNFGPWDKGPNHGFARIYSWSVKESGTTAEGHPYVMLCLTDSDKSRAMWNYSFELTYVVTLAPNQLQCTLSVENTGEQDFDFTALLHTYFRVPHIQNVAITGLREVYYRDQLTDMKDRLEDREQVIIGENVDRIYVGANQPVTICNVASSRAATKEDHSTVQTRIDVLLNKANLPDTVVWNPWIEKAKAMLDLEDEEYLRFVCVEAGSVAERVVLAAGDTWLGGQVLEVQRHR